jgi:hypothetical protein
VHARWSATVCHGDKTNTGKPDGNLLLQEEESGRYLQ